MNQSRYSYAANFTRSKLIGKYIYFEDQFSEPMAGVMFGLLGALVSNSSKSIVLDSETGLVTILNQEGKKKIILPHPEITAEYNKSKRRINDVRKAIEPINEKYALK